MKKLIKFLVVVICILLFILFLLKGYQHEKEDIASKIGDKVGESELSMSDYYNLARIIEDAYRQYLVQGDYRTAYSMLHQNYRAYTSYEDFENKMSGRDNSQLKVANIKRVTQTTYHVMTNVSGEDFTIIINQDESKFSLLPEAFLAYDNPNMTSKSNNLQCTLKDYLVNVNQTTFHMELKNTSEDEMHITKGMLYTNLDDAVEKSLDMIIPAKQSKEISISFDTNYAFPSKLILYRENGKKADIEYTFSIEK